MHEIYLDGNDTRTLFNCNYRKNIFPHDLLYYFELLLHKHVCTCSNEKHVRFRK